MRKLIFIFFIFCFSKSFAQVYQEMPQYGYRANRMAFDSTLQIPSVCGVPTLKSNVTKKAAIAFDSCNNRLYYYNPKTLSWSQITSGSSQNLQQVTDVGNTTNNSISLIKNNYTNQYLNLFIDSLTDNCYFEMSDSNGNIIKLSSVNSKSGNPASAISFMDGSSTYIQRLIQTQNSNPLDLYFPSSSNGNDTIATLSDIRNIPTYIPNGRFGNDTATIVMAKVHNDAGVQLTNGKVVYLSSSGTSSDVPSVRLANNKGDSSSANTFGFVTGTIAINDTGWIILSGKIEKLNTSAFSNGDIIYLDSISGSWTKSKPQAPYHLVYLGVVIKANAGNGAIFVKPINGFEISELHDVQMNGKVNNQIIVYSDTQKVWKNRSIYSVVDTAYVIGTKTNLSLKLNTSDSTIYYTKYRSDTSRTAIYNAINGKQASGTYVTSVTGTSPISSSGGTTPAISISQASSSTNGYLSSADYSTLAEGTSLAAIQSLGSSIKGITLTCPDFRLQLVSAALSNGNLYLIPVYIPFASTITGIKFFQGTQGVYTANNYNGVGLYSQSNGTLTLQASSTNDGNIWKGTANSWQTKAFSSTYSAAAGTYYIGFLYSSSGQTTAPTIGGAASLSQSGVVSLDMTNSNRLSTTISSQTSLTTPLTLSTTTTTGTMFGLFVY